MRALSTRHATCLAWSLALALWPTLARADHGALSLDLGTGVTALAVRPPYTDSGSTAWSLSLSLFFGVRYGLTNQLELTLGGFYDLPTHLTHAGASIRTVDSGTFTGTLEYELS